MVAAMLQNETRRIVIITALTDNSDPATNCPGLTSTKLLPLFKVQIWTEHVFGSTRLIMKKHQQF
jgi:hypothetical protein